jgi:hypothetical protein
MVIRALVRFGLLDQQDQQALLAVSERQKAHLRSSAGEFEEFRARI